MDEKKGKALAEIILRDPRGTCAVYYSCCDISAKALINLNLLLVPDLKDGLLITFGSGLFRLGKFGKQIYPYYLATPIPNPQFPIPKLTYTSLHPADYKKWDGGRFYH